MYAFMYTLKCSNFQKQKIFLVKNILSKPRKLDLRLKTNREIKLLRIVVDV